MKTLRAFILLYILAVVIALPLYFIRDGVIIQSTEDKIFEVLTASVPVFVILCLLYILIKIIRKTAKKIKKKKPSVGEGLDGNN